MTVSEGEQVKGDVEGARKVIRQVAYINGAPVPPGSLSIAKSSLQTVGKQGTSTLVIYF